MKNRLLITLVILGVAVLYNCSKRDLPGNWEELDRIYVKSTLIQSKQSSNDSLSLFTYIYSGDSLLREKQLRVTTDTINISPGTYNFITVNKAAKGIFIDNIRDFSKARVLMESDAISDLYAATIKNFTVSRYSQNNLNLELPDKIKKLEYQLVIEGARDSLEKCIIVQNGVSRGLYLSDYTQIFEDFKYSKLFTEASPLNDFTGYFWLMGLNPSNKEIEVQFVYKNNTTQSASVDLSNLSNENMYSRRLIMYIDIQRVNLKLHATIKSWILVEDNVNI
ncbi:MAG: hypothetical protein BGO30_05850 [Bacteroidetes bacterium 41-46]|nr:MAG: hypothetical protein BGO30_05850 [Bacteroidetes bacterium 41-46]